MSSRDWRAYCAAARGGLIALAILTAVPALGKAEPHHKADGAQDHGQTPKANERGSDALPVVVKVQGSDTPQQRAADHAEDVKRHDADQRWTIGIGIISIIAALAQVVALIWQVFYLRRTVRDSETAIKAAQRSAKAAEDAVGKSDEILTHAQDSSKFELRAYVSVDLSDDEDWGPNVIFGQEFSNFTVVIKNHGKTPALKVTMAGDMDIFSHPNPGVVPVPEVVPNSSVSVLFPGNDGGHSHVEARRLFDNADKVRFDADTHRVYAFGLVTYHDVFGAEHFTRFRYMMDPRRALFAECAEGNETDD